VFGIGTFWLNVLIPNNSLLKPLGLTRLAAFFRQKAQFPYSKLTFRFSVSSSNSLFLVRSSILSFFKLHANLSTIDGSANIKRSLFAASYTIHKSGSIGPLFCRIFTLISAHTGSNTITFRGLYSIDLFHWKDYIHCIYNAIFDFLVSLRPDCNWIHILASINNDIKLQWITMTYFKQYYIHIFTLSSRSNCCAENWRHCAGNLQQGLYT
jgi:hypothetical protein